MYKFRLNELLEKREGIPKCPSHPSEELSWICMERTCEKRIFCAFCVIQDHIKVHKDFANIYNLMEDPLKTFQKLDVANEQEDYMDFKKGTIKDRILSQVTREEDQLNDLFTSITMEFGKKLDAIRLNYREDVGKYLDSQDTKFEKIEEQRKDYSEFAKNYFENIDLSNSEQLKEGLEIILSKFYSDAELLENFEATHQCLPKVKSKEKYELSVKGKKLQELKWRSFATKDLYLGGNWTWDTEKNCGDIEFSNNDLTVRKKGSELPSTLLGGGMLSSGVTKFKITIDELIGSYVCIGIISSSIAINPKGNHYQWASCICSDGYVYNLVLEAGNIQMRQGDTYEFELNFDEDFFLVKGPQERFKYKKTGIKGQSYFAYLGFAALSRTKLTLEF